MVTSFKLNSQIFDRISAIDIFPFHLIFNLQEFIQAPTNLPLPAVKTQSQIAF